ncbi:MAG: GTP-binding protein [Bacillus sp. (in: Bacteria)]|nr:GTP-binding protein [Bacillus sp. (in: firmicutes)]
MNDIPVTILTGYLGSGKTTLLNEILKGAHGERIAVIVNEFGKIGIDNKLIIGVEEDLIELSNGCICCTVRSDLTRTLTELVESKGDAFDRVLIETTGLAHPGPIIHSFYSDPFIFDHYKLDCIVTVIDCYHIINQLERSLEVKEQIAFADMLILNKVDLLINETDLNTIKNKLNITNPTANLFETTFSRIEVDKLFNIFSFNLPDKLEIQSTVTKEKAHQEDIKAIILRSDFPLDVKKLDMWMNILLDLMAPKLYRYKGILHIKGSEKRMVFQGVHSLLSGSLDREWGLTEERVSEMVVIGRDLDEDWFQKQFQLCVAQ